LSSRGPTITSGTPWASDSGPVLGRPCDRRDRCVAPLCSVAGCMRHHPDHEDLAATDCRHGRCKGSAGTASPTRHRRYCLLAGPRRGGCLPARDRGGKAGLRQSSAGCQPTGGGSEPCLMMLARSAETAIRRGGRELSGGSW
jgi:hypothetical protein